MVTRHAPGPRSQVAGTGVSPGPSCDNVTHSLLPPPPESSSSLRLRSPDTESTRAGGGSGKLPARLIRRTGDKQEIFGVRHSPVQLQCHAFLPRLPSGDCGISSALRAFYTHWRPVFSWTAWPGPARRHSTGSGSVAGRGKRSEGALTGNSDVRGEDGTQMGAEWGIIHVQYIRLAQAGSPGEIQPLKELQRTVTFVQHMNTKNCCVSDLINSFSQLASFRRLNMVSGPLHTMRIVDNYIQLDQTPLVPALSAAQSGSRSVTCIMYLLTSLPPSGVTRCMRVV